MVNKKAEVVRVYLPPDANTLLSTYDHCLRSRQYVNVVVAGKQPAPNFLTMDQAIAHCTRGLGIWEWAGTEVPRRGARRRPRLRRRRADARGAGGGRHPAPRAARPQGARRSTSSTSCACRTRAEHPHGLSDREFDTLFTADKPVIFAYHGYPWLIHRLTYRRTGHANIHVRGYKEEGTTTTPFDMVMLNDLDRFHLVIDVIDRVPSPAARAQAGLRQKMVDERLAAREYTRDARRRPARGARLGLARRAATPAAEGEVARDRSRPAATTSSPADTTAGTRTTW